MDETNQIPPAPAEPTTPKKSMNKWVALVIFVLVLGGIAAGAYWLKGLPNQGGSPNPTPTLTPSTDTPKGSEPLVSGLVEWRYPTKTFLDIVKNDLVQSSQFYIVGKFKSGTYAGKNIYIAIVPSCEGPCPNAVLRVVETADTEKPYIILKNHSSALDNIEKGFLKEDKYTIDSSLKISDLSVPESIKGSGAKQTLTVAAPGFFQAPYNLFNSTNLKYVFTDSKVGDVYTSPTDSTKVDNLFVTNGFYVKAPDWNTLVYSYTPPFAGADKIPQVTWTQGGANKSEYLYTTIGGCGLSDYAALATGVKQTDLVATGKTAQGDSIFEFKDSNNALLKEAYEKEYNPFTTTKVSYEVYVANHPMFFWTDPFGRMIKFRRSEYFRTEAECGKPVIYLYPSQATDVSVQVSPVGGFTYTEPEYGTGWNVTAYPNGKIIAGGKEYPYLFWEGRGGLYKTPDKGFVVAKANVHNFLVDKLGKLGLNQKETADFVEFWQPRMSSAPYYFVTFMGNQVMDQIAPLQITPKPDTIIRVLMDFAPLDKPIDVEGYDIKTPQRKGFTVVEWGGVKR